MKARTNSRKNSLVRQIEQTSMEIKKPKHKDISRLAYHFYERDGKPEGKDLEHWFNAESMMESQFGYGSDHTEHDFSKATGDE